MRVAYLDEILDAEVVECVYFELVEVLRELLEECVEFRLLTAGSYGDFFEDADRILVGYVLLEVALEDLGDLVEERGIEVSVDLFDDVAAVLVLDESVDVVEDEADESGLVLLILESAHDSLDGEGAFRMADDLHQVRRKLVRASLRCL